MSDYDIEELVKPVVEQFIGSITKKPTGVSQAAVPQTIQKAFASVQHLVKNKFKSSEKKNTEHNYALYVFKYMLDNKIIINKCLSTAFRTGEVMDGLQFESYFNIQYNMDYDRQNAKPVQTFSSNV